MARLFDNPLSMLLILLAVVLLFGAPKLPGMARSLGQSLRIFKSEVTELEEDDQPAGSRSVVDGHPVDEEQGVTALPGPQAHS